MLHLAYHNFVSSAGKMISAGPKWGWGGGSSFCTLTHTSSKTNISENVSDPFAGGCKIVCKEADIRRKVNAEATGLTLPLPDQVIFS